jgi:hypothetical protein
MNPELHHRNLLTQSNVNVDYRIMTWMMPLLMKGRGRRLDMKVICALVNRS